ncbi:MAG TPA: hypothetical protein VGE43_04335, partial [Acidimicrobiales bacterium]
IGGLRDSRAIIPEPLAETLVARLKLHRLGGASEADFFGAHPDACDTRRDVLVRLVELTAPGRHATA